MIKAQLYCEGVIDYSDVKVYKDTSRIIMVNMQDSIIIELNKGDAKTIFIKLNKEIVNKIKEL